MNSRQVENLDVTAYRRKRMQTGSVQGQRVQKEQWAGSTQVQRGQRTGGTQGQREQQMTRVQMREARKKRRRRQVFIARFSCAFFICIIAGFIAFGIQNLAAKDGEREAGSFAQTIGAIFYKGNDWTIEDMFGMLEDEGIACTQDFLTINDYSRPGDELKRVKNIFVHYTANPGTSAAQNRSYFENLAETHETSASSHFIIGYEGEIVQCVPLDEIAYAVAGRNNDSISIECCYVDENGEFTEKTYQSLVRFSALL